VQPRRDGLVAATSAGADWREGRAAKLTGKVNIAVFAAFRCVIGATLRSHPEFKPRWANRQLDVSRYGWQKRQDGGKNGKVRGTVWTDSGTIWRIQDAVA